MKRLGIIGLLALTTSLTYAAFSPIASAQERVCIESERDGRIVCGRRVRGDVPGGAIRDDWRDQGNRGDNRCGGNFDENFYLIAYPDVAQAVTRRQIRSACDHYLTFGRFEGRLPQFSESSYLSKNPDVANAVRLRQFRSGYEHWQRFGRLEGRKL